MCVYIYIYIKLIDTCINVIIIITIIIIIILIIYVCGPALLAYYPEKYPPKEKSCGPFPQSNNQIRNGKLFQKKKKVKEKKKRE